MTNRKIFILLGLSALIVVVAAWWVLITPDNPLTSLFRRQISDIQARIVIGPYPAERDFRLLKQNNVGLVVSLLDPAIPYEATLLGREKILAAQYQIALENYPMSSILGQKFGNDYDVSASKAAAAIAGTTAKVYLHCYLGQHRIQSVRTILAGKGIVAGTYVVRTGERAEAAKQLDTAESAYNTGEYQAALAILGRIEESQLTDNARLLRAWSHYRNGNIGQARDLFQAFQSQHRDDPQAAIGLGYCGYRMGDYATAETQFLGALKQVPDNADALGGLGLTYSRAGRRDDAVPRLSAALAIAPGNQEFRDALERARTSK